MKHFKNSSTSSSSMKIVANSFIEYQGHTILINYVINMFHSKVRAMLAVDADDFPTIFIDYNLSDDQKRKAIEHEIGHIVRKDIDHIYDDDIADLEKGADAFELDAKLVAVT